MEGAQHAVYRARVRAVEAPGVQEPRAGEEGEKKALCERFASGREEMGALCAWPPPCLRAPACAFLRACARRVRACVREEVRAVRTVCRLVRLAATLAPPPRLRLVGAAARPLRFSRFVVVVFWFFCGFSRARTHHHMPDRWRLWGGWVACRVGRSSARAHQVRLSMARLKFVWDERLKVRARPRAHTRTHA